jgi:hypothetical protein
VRCSINAGVTRSPAASIISSRTSSRLYRPAGLDLGYSDAAHFTRAFRGWTGPPPTEWQRLAASLETGAPMGR